MENISLDSQIEAILFWKGEPLSIKKLAECLGRKEEEITNSLEELKQKISERGVELIYKDGEVMLGTAAKLSHIIERLTKEELVRDLGKAGLETISIIAYKGPISRAEIDYIRGVQSNFILRNLQIRGLVEKIINEKDRRSYLYRPTFELLTFLGISRIEELPEFEDIKNEFALQVEENSTPDIKDQTKTSTDNTPPEEITNEDMNENDLTPTYDV